MSYHELQWFDVVLSAGLILINAAVSFVLRLGLGRTLLLASFRAFAQLALVGLVLKWVFGFASWPAIVVLVFMMTAIAGRSAAARSKRRYSGMSWVSTLGMSASWLVTAFAMTVVIRPADWSSPPAQFVIPLMGMMLGNALNGVALGLDRFTEDLLRDRGRIEMQLTLGATRWEAARDTLRSAVRTGMIPILNSMMVVGIVSLPGMMTGQILAGATPLSAVKYQIVIMFLLAATTAIGTVTSVLTTWSVLFNKRHQLLYERLA